MRNCEICNKNDVDTNVHSSSLGGFSMNYCLVCSAIGAEQSGLQDVVGGGYTTYNSNDDRYYDSSDNHVPIVLKSGLSFDTRSEFVSFHTK